MKNFRLAILSICATILTACSGGSGDGDDTAFVGAANVSISATPRDIDTGDRMKVRVNIDNIHEDGITLKVRYPSALSYVQETSFLELNVKKSINTSPQFISKSNDDDTTYLIYMFDPSIFQGTRQGTLTFELRGDGPTPKDDDEVLLAVDADVLTDEFDPVKPEFSAEDFELISVGAEN